MNKLTIKQERFAQEYVSHGSASNAYRVAYNASNMTDEAIHVCASRVKTKVKLRIDELQKIEADKYNLTRDKVFNLWIQIVTADPNDLVQVRHKSCSHCYPIVRRPQPNPECSECLGEGEAYMYVSDTRNLTGAAKLLYVGARKTKSGVEIIMRDQAAALVNIAKYLGMFKDNPASAENNHHSIPEVLPIDPIEAARIYQQIMRAN